MTVEGDVVQVVAVCRKLAADMGVDKVPPIGAMIETPAAALTVRSLVKYVDFVCFGSSPHPVHAVGRTGKSLGHGLLHR